MYILRINGIKLYSKIKVMNPGISAFLICSGCSKGSRLFSDIKSAKSKKAHESLEGLASQHKITKVTNSVMPIFQNNSLFYNSTV